jgi:hypothetical protein
MQDIIASIQRIPIRLTDERWAHITEEHCELAGLRLEVLETVAKPERVLAGGEGEFLAIRELYPGKWWLFTRNLRTTGSSSPPS